MGRWKARGWGDSFRRSETWSGKLEHGYQMAESIWYRFKNPWLRIWVTKIGIKAKSLTQSYVVLKWECNLQGPWHLVDTFPEPEELLWAEIANYNCRSMFTYRIAWKMEEGQLLPGVRKLKRHIPASQLYHSLCTCSFLSLFLHLHIFNHTSIVQAFFIDIIANSFFSNQILPNHLPLWPQHFASCCVIFHMLGWVLPRPSIHLLSFTTHLMEASKNVSPGSIVRALSFSKN